MKTIRANYGLVFTAFGAGAIVGNLLAGQLRDLVGNYVVVSYLVAILAIADIGDLLLPHSDTKPSEQ